MRPVDTVTFHDCSIALVVVVVLVLDWRRVFEDEEADEHD
jgi:hypothetical protein